MATIMLSSEPKLEVSAVSYQGKDWIVIQQGDLRLTIFLPDGSTAGPAIVKAFDRAFQEPRK